jgi:predicted Zn finger-like uncharacterized protein
MIANAMLVTTCPECETTFRISVGILEKAGGQVRCGRCARIFDANVDLREIEDAAAVSSTGPKFQFGLEAGPEAPPDTEGNAGADAERDSPSGDAELAAADDKPDDDAADATVPEWLHPIERPEQRRTWPWAAGAALLGVMLAGQLMHRFRTELLSVPAVGAVLQRGYSVAGVELVAPVDLDQFDLLDLTALAEPAGEEPGWLIIETRLQNNGPKAQPYPHIFVRLLDRWEDTVAGRYFAPNEYTVSAVDDYSSMNTGTAVDAQFIIMDPGLSATGFELELCARVAQGFMCESDTNFR